MEEVVQELVNKTEELEAPVNVDARNNLEINDMEEPKEISAGISVAETTVETNESAHTEIVYTPSPSPSPKDMFMSPTPPIDIQESWTAKHGSMNKYTPIGLEVVNSNRTSDDDHCFEEYPFGEGSHCGTVKAMENWRRILVTEASY